MRFSLFDKQKYVPTKLKKAFRSSPVIQAFDSRYTVYVITGVSKDATLAVFEPSSGRTSPRGTIL